MESSPGEGRRPHCLVGGGGDGGACLAPTWRRRLPGRPRLASRLEVPAEQVDGDDHQHEERNNTCETSNATNSRLINAPECTTSGPWTRPNCTTSTTTSTTTTLTTKSIAHWPYINSTNKRRRRNSPTSVGWLASTTSHRHHRHHDNTAIKKMLPSLSKSARRSSSWSLFTLSIKQIITLVLIISTLTVSFVAALQQSPQVNFIQSNNNNNNQIIPTSFGLNSQPDNQNLFDNNNPIVTAQLESFGSRLGAQAAAAVASFPSAPEAGEQLQPQVQPAAPDAPFDPTSGLFANRQGQLDDPAAQFQQRRPPRQPSPLAANSNNNNNNANRQQQQQQQRQRQQQQQQLPVGQPLQSTAGQQQQGGQFQRLRAPPGVEQFPRPLGAGQQQAFLQTGNQQQAGRQQQNNQLQLNLPTLSAFDLSSLANLANNPGAPNNNNPQVVPANGQPFNPQSAGQLQPTFRRLPPQASSQQQQQAQRANNNNIFDGLSRAQQVPNAPPPPPQQPQVAANSNGFLAGANTQANPTELPFIRQVFRPTENNAAELINSNNEFSRATSLSSGRPTPPPLFVPGRQQPANTANTRQQANSRPLVESGFSPIRPSSEVFFEPNQNRQQVNQNNRQQQTNQRLQPPGVANGSQPVARPASNNEQSGLQRAKPPVRRPSQRPQVPAATSLPSPGSAFATSRQQQLQQQATPLPPSANDVIRLASSAIQTVNDGLTALTGGQFGLSSTTPSIVTTTTAGSQQAADQTSPSSQVDSSSSPSTGASLSSTTTEGNAPLSTTTLANLGSSEPPSRRNAAPLPLRTSANFFSLTSAATLSPSSFSPALPINAAVAASGGRRRIPVRTNPQSLSSQRQQQQQQPPTTTMASNQPVTTPISPVTLPTTTFANTQPPAPATTTTSTGSRSQAASVSVRRPEIEEFYETIGNGFSSTSLNSIDRFSAPSRQQPASSTTTTSSTTPTAPTTVATSGANDDESASRQPGFTTTAATSADLYGSRLNAAAEQPASASGQPDVQVQRQPQLKPAESPPARPQVSETDETNSSASNSNSNNNNNNNNNPVLVPVTYMTTLTYLTTVLHGTHTLETSHESVERSTKLATLNAQLMDQIEHRLPLIEPTATVSLSSKTKGRGTTIINLKSAVSAYNQELVEALGTGGPSAAQPQQPEPTSVSAGPLQTLAPVDSSGGFQQVPFKRQKGQQQQRVSPNEARASRTVELAELQEAKKSLLTEYVYSYTMRPVADQQQVAATSVRSELVPGPSVDGAELANQLQLYAAGGGNGPSNVIDSNGLLRLEPANEFASPLNLGSTIGKESPSLVTEVNLNVATYVSFEGISNALVDVVRPSRLGAAPAGGQAAGSQAGARPPLGSQLDTSFNVHLTLGNALEQLHSSQFQSGQQTPALDLVRPTSKPDDLLRQPQPTTAGGQQAASQQQQAPSAGPELAQNPQSRAQASSLARSQLRSRVASSRFRSGPLQTLVPNRAANLQPTSPTVPAASSSSAAPTESLASSAGRRPNNKSRLARPQLKSTASADSADSVAPSADVQQPPSSPAAAAAPSTSLASATRSSKPRFVVVTRTGQFGIRASAISSLAAAQSSANSNPEASIEPTGVPTVRVSSRFSKPNRFRGPSQSIQVTRVPPEQLAASSSNLISPSQVAPTTAASATVQTTTTTNAPTQQDGSPTSPPASEQTGAGSSSPTSPATDSDQQNNRVAAADERVTSSVPPPDANLLAGAVKLDPSQSIVVTYFTTTTHTIPFTLNSETVFTTLEETNSRIATEFVGNLAGQFVEPTPVASMASSTQLASLLVPSVTTTSPTTSGDPAPSDQSTSTTSTTSQPAQQGQQQPQPQQPDNRQQEFNRNQQIEPSFVVSLNTRTYFTTFTAFTTYTLASDSISVKSSESTTSSIVTETVTSRFEPTDILQTISPPLTRLSADTQTISPLVPPVSEQSSAPIEPSMTTQTVLSTMTYFGTLYNGTQTTLTPIVDVSTQVVTLSSPSFNVNSDLISSPVASSSIEATQVAEMSTRAQTASDNPAATSSPTLDQQKEMITRTKSMYTTLTHFITFYSGTKTQLSTIQEISPTVVTEFIDKTLFEQQQQQSSESSVIQMIVPTQAPVDSSGMIQATQTLTSPSDQSLSSASVTGSDQSTLSGEQTSEGGSTSTSTSTTATSSSMASSETPTTTPAPKITGELDSVRVDRPEGPNNAENQSVSQSGGVADDDQGKVLASSANGRDLADSRQNGNTNIIELSDLIAANSSQSGRVALAGNLGNAIKDIVQLLAGNKTNTLSPLANLGQQQPTTSSISETSTSEQPATTVTTTTTSAATTAPKPTSSKAPTRVFGNKSREQQQLMSQLVQGSMSSPSVSVANANGSPGAEASTSVSPSLMSSNVRTPELASTSIRERNNQQQQQQPAATIFFGDDGGDERKKAIKTVWPGAQSTIFVTSIESSTRSLIVTTTKVYYTRDSPLTITSSLTSVIAPRTFVSTIMGTRTLVNQLNGPTASATLQQTPQQVNEKKAPTTPGPSRQDSQAASHRLSVQQKVQKQQAQVEQQQKRQQQQQEQILRQQKAKQAAAAAAAAAPKSAELPASNINQCQPMCKLSQNEICKFTPTLEATGAQGTFACACRPGYYMTLNQVGQRQCQEVQSYVILLRLLQIGDQQVSFKRELQSKSSSEFKQYARIVKDHVKRAYMTSELTRDRFVGAEILNFARVSPSLVNSATSSSSSPAMAAALASQQPLVSSVGKPINLTAQLLDPLNSGVIVNMTIYLQAPPSGSNEIQIDESMLKEELTKKLNMRQAAALAAAAAAVASGQPPPVAPASTALGQDQSDSSNATSSTTATVPANSSSAASAANQPDEFLPNPNALFLADVEQVHDLDECASPNLNDCHEGAVCINEPGSYRCDCRDYPDLNPLNPGRQCASELKSCDYCNNRGDCLRVPSTTMAFNSSSAAAATTTTTTSTNVGRSQFSTICQCHRIYLGRRCEINGLLLATLLPIAAIFLIISVCLVIYCCRRWRKRSALHKGFRNIGTFGPNLIGGTLDRKAMLESSSESSDTHQRSHAHHQQQHQHHAHHHLRAAAANGIYDTHGGLPSEPCSSSSNESSPRQMVRNQLVEGGLLQAGPGQASAAYQLASPAATQAQPSLSPYCNSIPPQIVIPRARHNQVNYAVHRGQVYMW